MDVNWTTTDISSAPEFLDATTLQTNVFPFPDYIDDTDTIKMTPELIGIVCFVVIAFLVIIATLGVVSDCCRCTDKEDGEDTEDSVIDPESVIERVSTIISYCDVKSTKKPQSE